MEKIQTAELMDDELDQVAGGCHAEACDEHMSVEVGPFMNIVLEHPPFLG